MIVRGAGALLSTAAAAEDEAEGAPPLAGLVLAGSAGTVDEEEDDDGAWAGAWNLSARAICWRCHLCTFASVERRVRPSGEM